MMDCAAKQPARQSAKTMLRRRRLRNGAASSSVKSAITSPLSVRNRRTIQLLFKSDELSSSVSCRRMTYCQTSNSLPRLIGALKAVCTFDNSNGVWRIRSSLAISGIDLRALTGAVILRFKNALCGSTTSTCARNRFGKVTRSTSTDSGTKIVSRLRFGRARLASKRKTFAGGTPQNIACVAEKIFNSLSHFCLQARLKIHCIGMVAQKFVRKNRFLK